MDVGWMDGWMDGCWMDGWRKQNYANSAQFSWSLAELGKNLESEYYFFPLIIYSSIHCSAADIQIK